MGFNGYLITVIITAIASVAVSAVLIRQVVKLISCRIKLSHSINLVELKASKLVFFVLAAIIGALLVYVIMQMISEQSPSVLALRKLFGVGWAQANIAFMFVLIAMLAAETFFILLGLSRNAVVDKGVYTNFGLLDWHQVRDYIIDEEKSILVLSSDRRTFSTLRGITPPFRVAHSDIEKLKFILNKNKNKFSDFDGDI